MQVEKAFHGGASFDAIGVDFKTLDGHDQIINADVLDSWYDPSPNVIAAIEPHLSWLIKTSPPTHGEGLKSVIAASRGISESNIVLGGGTSSLMYQAFPKLVSQTSTVTLLDPMYGEYSHIFSQVIGCKVNLCPLLADEGFQPDLDLLAQTAVGSDLVVLVNPNSPTGVYVDLEFLQGLLGRLGPKTYLWVDETYIDFAPTKASLETLVATDDRIIVSKSMSKFYGLSGLRVGYLVCNSALAADLERTNPPWSVGLLAQVAGIEALQDTGFYDLMVEQTSHLREHLIARLSELTGIRRVFNSVANYVLFELDQPKAQEVCEKTQVRGVFIRNCDALSARFENRFIRTAVKSAPENARIVEAIREALA